MLRPTKPQALVRKDDRIIIHFDYDCFYASVVENEDPQLKNLPLAIQQKQIIVTCNYEARRRGLHKLQLITEARKVCPDVIIVLGEDLTRFRDASKDLYNYLRAFSWSDKVERLGFDEVWMDVTDIVEYNAGVLNSYDLERSFFQLQRDDPTAGFVFDATRLAGHSYPASGATNEIGPRMEVENSPSEQHLATRLMLGSHLALHLRRQLDEHKGYTCTVGISTNKTLSKLVGNLNKPKGQTTLMPPYSTTPDSTPSSAQALMDSHDVGSVPWIGFKLAQKMREHYLGKPADFNDGLVYGKTKEKITVRDIRMLPDLSPEMLEKLLSGAGSQKGIGARVHGLLHGVDDTEVGQARNVPRQISIEDSYIRLDTVPQLMAELTTLSRRLLQRMRLDLTERKDRDPPQDDRDDSTSNTTVATFSQRWIGRPSTLRLTTRPRQPLQADGSRIRTFKRISRSTPLPSFVFSLFEHIDALTDRLVSEALVPLFKKLHPEKSGWNLSLVNVAVTDMVDTGSGSKASAGRDIGKMLRGQDGVLKDFRVVEEHEVKDTTKLRFELTEKPPEDASSDTHTKLANECSEQEELSSLWQADSDLEDEGEDASFYCELCENAVPLFARGAHERFHTDG